MHLYFLIHGLYGNAGHMESVAEALEEALDDKKALIYRAKSTERFKTFDGIELPALRLADELLKLLNSKNVTHISIIGYSMGGLYARFLVGLLLEYGLFDRLTPVDFMTFATPHAGSILWQQSWKATVINGMARKFLGPSGVDLMAIGPNSLIDQMADPKSTYYQALQKFPNLVLFCNAVGDRTVKFWSSYITNMHAFPHGTQKYDVHTFYDYEGNKHGEFLVDMQVPTTHLKRPPKNEDEKTDTHLVINLVWFISPFVLTILLGVSVSRWFMILLERPFKRHRVHNSLKLYTSDKHSNANLKTPNSSEGEFEQTKDDLQVAVEELSAEQPCVTVGVVIDEQPKPVLHNESKLIDSCTNYIKMIPAVDLRIMNLNQLPWKKYVAYLTHHRTHAHIVDRMRDGESPATDLLRFFATSTITKTS